MFSKNFAGKNSLESKMNGYTPPTGVRPKARFHSFQLPTICPFDHRTIARWRGAAQCLFFSNIQPAKAPLNLIPEKQLVACFAEMAKLYGGPDNALKVGLVAGLRQRCFDRNRVFFSSVFFCTYKLNHFLLGFPKAWARR